MHDLADSISTSTSDEFVPPKFNVVLPRFNPILPRFDIKGTQDPVGSRRIQNEICTIQDAI